MDCAVKSGYPYVNASQGQEIDYADALSKEFQSYFYQEDVFEFFSKLDLPNLSNKDASELLADIVPFIHKGLSGLTDYFKKLCHIISSWQLVWGNLHAFMSTKIPIATYSSLIGKRKALCAALTIGR